MHFISDILSEVKEESQEQASGRANIKNEGLYALDSNSTPPSTPTIESPDDARGGGGNDISETSSSCPLLRIDGGVAATEEVMAFQSNATVPAAESDAGIQYRLQGTFTR